MKIYLLKPIMLIFKSSFKLLTFFLKVIVLTLSSPALDKEMEECRKEEEEYDEFVEVLTKRKPQILL